MKEINIKELNIQELSEKDELLKELKDSPETNLNFFDLMTAYLIVFLILAVTIPKIYMANEIYYSSRDIAKLRNELNVLIEENKGLKYKLEKIRYKNQIIDNMN